MSALADPRIAVLQNQAGSSGELDLPVGDGCFRINLRDENIALWQETFDQHTTAANLLLACEESIGDLKDTRLTWVVGSAIRTATASSPDAVGWLLTQLGVPTELTEAAISRCHGMGRASKKRCRRRLARSSIFCGVVPRRNGRDSPWVIQVYATDRSLRMRRLPIRRPSSFAARRFAPRLYR